MFRQNLLPVVAPGCSPRPLSLRQSGGGARPLRALIALLLLTVLLPVLLPGLAAAGELPKVVLQLDKPVHADAAGYVAALERGYYREAGLAVEVLPGAADVDPVLEVLEKRADFGIGDTTLLMRYADGQPVLVLAAIYQHSPGALIALQKSGITSARDLVGKKVMIEPALLPLTLTFLREEGVPAEALQIIPYSGRLNELISGTVDAQTVNLFHDDPVLTGNDIAYTIIKSTRPLPDFYSGCLFTSRSRMQQDPQMAERFLEATRRGWNYALSNPEETADWLSRKYGSLESKQRLLRELQLSRNYILPEVVDIGHMSPTRWHEIAGTYSRAHLLPANLNLGNFFHNPLGQEKKKFERYLTLTALGAGAVLLLLTLLLLYSRRLQRAIRKRTRELQENQSRLEMALEGSGDGIWDWDLASDRIYFNPQWVRSMEYLPENFPQIFRHWLNLLHPDDQKTALSRAEGIRLGKSPLFELECRVRTGSGSWRWMLLRGKTQAGARVAGTNVDITDKKKATQELQSRLYALISPEHSAQDLTFNDIFELHSIQALQDGFAEAFGVSSLIVAPDGRPLTQPTNFTRLCDKVVRSTEFGRQLCVKTGQRLNVGEVADEAPVVTCQACGLLDGGAGIYAGEKHLATWLVGQVLPQEYTPEEQTALAVRCGVDPATFREALAQVPRMDRARFNKICAVLGLFARQLSQLAWQNVAQGRVIHDLNAAEQKLLENEAVLKEAQAIAHVGHWNYRVLEDLYDCSDEARRILGLPRTGRLELASLREVLHADDRAQFDRLWEQSLTTGEPLKTNLRVVVAETVRHIYLRGVVLGGSNGKPEYLLGILQDISERVEREKALREQEENLRITLDSIADGVIAADYSGRITRMNPVAQELTGWNIMEARGKPLPEIFRTADLQTRQPCGSPVERVLQDGVQSGQPVELLLLARDETARTISCSASPIRNEKGVLVGAVLVLRDMTGQHQLEEQLRQAQKLEAIGQLAGGVAHDFNNLLGGIMGFAELLKLGSEEGGKNAHYAGQIMATAGRAAQLTSQLLTFARKGQLPSTLFDAHQTINEAVSILRHSIDRRIEIFLNFRALRHIMTGDPAQIQNAVLNLGINARDAMPEGGRLEISTEDVRLGREYCESSAFRLEPGEYMQLTVRDTGTGISPENMSRIFDPFFTTKQIGKGTGLGLAAVFGTVTAHGGAIDVTSEVGKGTEFRICLPAEEETCLTCEVKEPEALTQTGKGHTVLVIDDEPVIRTMAANLLGAAGFTVLTAANGQEGAELYRQRRSGISVVIVDMVMPVLDGVQTMQELLKIDPGVRVLAASGFSQNERIDRMLAEGAKDFIHKPYNLREILAKIEPLLSNPSA